MFYLKPPFLLPVRFGVAEVPSETCKGRPTEGNKGNGEHGKKDRVSVVLKVERGAASGERFRNFIMVEV